MHYLPPDQLDTHGSNENSNKYNLTFSYLSPDFQDTVSEAIKFQGFVLSLNRLLDLDSNYKKFEAKIPFNGWTYPGSASAVIRVN